MKALQVGIVHNGSRPELCRQLFSTPKLYR